MSFTTQPSLPSLPSYTAAPTTATQAATAPTPAYSNPGAYNTLGTQQAINNTSVASAGQVNNSAQSVENALPANLQLANDPTSPQAMQQYQQAYYNQNLNPAIQQSLANQYGSSGGGNSTFANAIAGQAIANGATDWDLASQQYATNNLNNQLAQRSSYFGNDVNLAQTQANQSTANQQFQANALGTLANNQNSYNMQNSQNANNFSTDVYGQQNQMNMQNAQMTNSYNLANSGMANQFNMGNFNNAMDLYNAQYAANSQQGQNTARMVDGSIGMAAGIASQL